MRSAKSIGLLMLIGLAVSFPGISGLFQVPGNLNSGPFINSIIYKVMPRMDQRVLAMQAGEIEMDTNFIDPNLLQYISDDPAISTSQGVRNGYGYYTINCRDWPLNETVLRQAFAYAFNKTRVASVIWDGWSLEHDSLVPYPNSWCVEDQLPYHYYTAQPIVGNQMLNDSGKFPFGLDGYRTYNGQPFDIEIAYIGGEESILIGMYPIAVEALLSLHINATGRPMLKTELSAALDSHGNYDIALGPANFYNNDVDWLAYEFWSENANVTGKNPSNFRNETYDRCREQLLHGTTYEEVYNASYWMQMILHEQVPMLVVYEQTYVEIYRIDKFVGQVPDLGRHIADVWTMRKIHRLDGGNGGTVTIAIPQDIDSINIFKAKLSGSLAILSELYSSLYRYGPDSKPYPDLATNYTVETHADNSAVPDGHIRYTIDIVDNATWTDGVPLTANDVAFTYNYAYESYAYGNPTGPLIQDLESAVALTPTRVRVEFNTVSYWHFRYFAYMWIIPEHIFNDVTGIGYNGWNTWNPVFDPESPHVTCGPFVFVDYEPNQWYKLAWNPLFHYRVNESLHQGEVTPTTDSIITANEWFLSSFMVSFSFSAVTVVILFVVCNNYRHRKSETA
jgi:ABC-type transport system substrate-binding protein